MQYWAAILHWFCCSEVREVEQLMIIIPQSSSTFTIWSLFWDFANDLASDLELLQMKALILEKNGINGMYGNSLGEWKAAYIEETLTVGRRGTSLLSYDFV